MEKRYRVYLSFLVIILLIILLYFFTSWFSKTTGFIIGTESEEVLFARCLKNKDVVLYLTEKCPGCQSIKEIFKDGFSELNYIDCFSSRECHNLLLLPAWKINGEIFYELNGIEELRAKTGC